MQSCKAIDHDGEVTLVSRTTCVSVATLLLLLLPLDQVKDYAFHQLREIVTTESPASVLFISHRWFLFCFI